MTTKNKPAKAKTLRRSTTDMYLKRRRAAFRAISKESKAQAFLITRAPDMRYLAGYGGEGHLLMGKNWTLLIPGHFFVEQAKQECGQLKGIEIVTEFGPGLDAIAKSLRGRNVRSLGIQAEEMTVQTRDALQEKLGKKKLVSMANLKRAGRIVKDDSEVKLVRRAIKIAQDALKGMTDQGAKYFVGRTERDITGELECRMKQLGAVDLGFPSIVAAGPHASRCHHIPSTRKLKMGEQLLIDWGANYEGYRSDLTRTLFMGTIPPKIAEIYPIVLEANKAAIAKVRSGVSCASVDAAAREVIEAAGYGKEFCHGLGHGLGLDVHEEPFLSKTSTSRLKAGMLITIEPGIYFPGIGGVRIEDDVLVTAKGCKVLSTFPKELNQVVLP